MKQPASINHIQVKHYVAWLRKIVKEGGKDAVIGSATRGAVDTFLECMGFAGYSFEAGGELTTPENEVLTSHWTSIGYYVYNDDHALVINAGEALTYALYEKREAYLV